MKIGQKGLTRVGVGIPTGNLTLFKKINRQESPRVLLSNRIGDQIIFKGHPIGKVIPNNLPPDPRPATIIAAAMPKIAALVG